MQAEKSAFFICQTSVMPLLGGKGTGLPRIRVKAALRAGRLKENHRQALTQKGNPGNEGL